MCVKFLLQIYHEAKKFGKVYNINVVCAYGGGSMWEQTKACQEGAEIIVATPVSTHVLLKISSFCLYGSKSLYVDMHWFNLWNIQIKINLEKAISSVRN